MVRLRCREQASPDGLGAAVLLARSEIERGPFAVLLPDDVVREGAGANGREMRRMLPDWYWRRSLGRRKQPSPKPGCAKPHEIR
jgi:UTP-glucose-1-phosphate uridylyltransferase